jgi:L-fuculose-phosphate aldolase
MMGTETDLRKAVTEAGQDLARQGMMPGAVGNLSTRMDEEHVLMTPSGVAKGRLQPEDLLVVDLAGRVVSGLGRPSSEGPLHLAVYRRYPDVGAVIHAHPPKTTAMAVAHLPISVGILAEALFTLGDVAHVDYLPPSAPELASAVAHGFEGADAVVLLSHGAVTVGRTVGAAARKMEMLEALAGVLLDAHLLGNVAPLPQFEVERLRNQWRQRRWQRESGR